MPEGKHKRIKSEEIKMILKKVGLKIIKHDYFLLIPIYIPVVTTLVNKFLEPILKRLSFIEYFLVVRDS